MVLFHPCIRQAEGIARRILHEAKHLVYKRLSNRQRKTQSCPRFGKTTLMNRMNEGYANLAEVRHGMNVKPPKSFRISSGCCEVCTTF
jgi:hypothetical protein